MSHFPCSVSIFGIPLLRTFFERLLIAAFLMETLQVSPVFLGRVLHNKRSTALGARPGHRFIPKGKGTARITGAAIEEAPSLRSSLDKLSTASFLRTFHTRCFSFGLALAPQRASILAGRVTGAG
jgi:hypothetical protein